MGPNAQDSSHSEETVLDSNVELKGEKMKPNEQNANPSEKAIFDPGTLYRMAEVAAKEEGVPQRWREDAVAEYVARAWRAGEEADSHRNPRAYQCRMGRGAIQNFLRRERRQEALSPGSCTVGAKRVSIDKMIRMRDGERVPMAETIEDKNAEQPDARMLEAERNEAVKRAVGALDPVAREVVQRVLMGGRTQVETASALGLSRQKVQRILDQACPRLRRLLSAYEPEYNRQRY